MSRSDISTTQTSAGLESAADAGTAGEVLRPVAADRAAPRVWLLASYRAGENTQLRALAEQLGRPFRFISTGWGPLAAVAGLLRLSTLAGVDPADRSEIAPPWPDLVITAGLRNEPVATYIQRASGGSTRVVFVGRSWRRHRDFDLLVTTPQYRIAAGPGVQVNLLTQHRVTAERLKAASAAPVALLDGITGPLIAVLVGGSSGPYVLGLRAAAQLARELVTLRDRFGGSLVVSSSSRTPASFLAALEERLDGEARVYRWLPDDPDNPYYAMLARADALVVSGDSVAMLSEAAAAAMIRDGVQKPVFIFDIPTDSSGDSTLAARWYRFMMRFLPDRLTRDVGLFHRAFVSAGLGSFLGRPSGNPPGAATAAATGGEATAHLMAALLDGAISQD